MLRRRFLVLPGLSVAASLAGCAFGRDADVTPTPDGRQTVRVEFSNASERSLRFTAAALPSGLGGVTIRYRDGTERTFADANDLGDIDAEAWTGAVTFTPLADDARVRRFRSTDGSGFGTTFDELPRGTQVVAAVADPVVENSLLNVAGGACGDVDVAEIQVEVNPAGVVSVFTTCTEEATQ